LQSAGFATLEIDMWAARGTNRGAKGRAASVPQTLPDAFAALAFLASQPEIDPKRIAIIGFSWGGAVTLLSATRRYAEALAEPGQAFAAHAAFYPVLWSYNKVPGHEFGDLTGAPVLIQAGAADAYDDAQVYAGFLDGLAPQTRPHVSLIVHPDATHAFDRALPSKVINDPYAHKGAGGPVLFEHNAQASALACETLIKFLAAALAVAPSSIERASI
jgi:dienelactone hydrolase